MDVDKKGIAALIVKSAPKPSSEMDAESEAESEEEEGLNYAVDDILAAFEARDPGMLKESLKSFITMCK